MVRTCEFWLPFYCVNFIVSFGVYVRDERGQVSLERRKRRSLYGHRRKKVRKYVTFIVRRLAV